MQALPPETPRQAHTDRAPTPGVAGSVPPALAERMLARALPGRSTDPAVLGDLAEEHHAVAAARGVSTARRWYWRQATSLAVRALVQRATASGHRPSTRPRRGDSIMEQLWRDLRLAGRTFVRQPGFALTAIVTLAAGLAANAAIFALLDAIILRPLAFRDLDRLVQVFGSAPTKDTFSDRSNASAADFVEWRQQVKSAEALVAYGWWDATVSAAREPERVQAFRVSPGFFGAIGIEPQGRGFLAEEGTPGRDRVAVISHALWTRKYTSDPHLIGSTIRLDGEPYTVVGIAPPRFDFPMGAEVWAALSFTPEQLQNRWRIYRVIGRLRDGRTAADLQAELATIARRQAEAFPDTNRGWTVNVMPLAKAVVDIGNGPFLAMWQVSALLLLLMACVNVASLLLVRGASRHKELALRLALGAHRGRIVRQLLVESLALSLAGALVAIPLTSITLTFCRRAMPARIARFIPGWDQIGVDLRLIAVMAVCASIAAVVFGLMPALRASRVALTESLKDGGRSPGGGRQRLRSGMVLVEIALALTLLVAAGLSVRGSIEMLTRSDGYDAEDAMTMLLSLPPAKYKTSLERRQFFDALVERARVEPGVDAASLVNILPSNGNNASRTVEIDGRPTSGPEERRTPDYRVITPEYFQTMRIRMISGRAFDARDRENGQRVAIVSRTMAERYWSGDNPVGRRLRAGDDGPWLTVVGIVDDVRHTWFDNRLDPTFYVPLAQEGPSDMALVLFGSSDAAARARAGRAAVQALDADQAVYDVMTMRQVRADRTLGLRFAAAFMGGFGLVGLVLAAVGVYGVMACAVSERTHEIGVRIALGASRRAVIASTVGRGLMVTGAGLLVGLAGAFALGRVMESMLFGAIRLDPVSFVVFPGVLALAALVATIVPARRALRVDPIVALRGQ
jgi:putative ABC transport system permease protein